MLEVKGLEVGYSERMVLKGLDFQVVEGNVVAVLGANGAGKTTLLRTIVGLMHPHKGRILFRGDDISRLPAHEIVSRGISLMPEGRQIFSRLTVEENLRLGAYLQKEKASFKADLEWIFELFPLLKTRIKQPAGSLSGGEQQMLAIGRALMSRPKLLLLDEPSMGLAPLLVAQIYEIVSAIHAQGTTVLVVEQNAHMALSVAQQAYVLETGKLVLGGPAAELARDDRVRKAYLGEV
jgi:branched-chain amino acid transport system ATP-binding protein